jgi:hypothetical protein
MSGKAQLLKQIKCPFLLLKYQQLTFEMEVIRLENLVW